MFAPMLSLAASALVVQPNVARHPATSSPSISMAVGAAPPAGFVWSDVADLGMGSASATAMTGVVVPTARAYPFVRSWYDLGMRLEGSSMKGGINKWHPKANGSTPPTVEPRPWLETPVVEEVVEASTVSSWYDSGARLVDVVPSWYDSDLRL